MSLSNHERKIDTEHVIRYTLCRESPYPELSENNRRYPEKISMKKLRLLLIVTAEEDARLLLGTLKAGGYAVECRRIMTMSEMQTSLANQEWDLIVCDYEMPNFSAPAALETLKTSGLDLPFIIISEKSGEEKLVEAMRSGANDYVMIGNLSRLIPAVDRELREATQRRASRQAEQAIRQGKMEWEAAFDSVSDIIILTDPKGTIIRCNRKLIDYFRTTYTGVLGREITELFYGGRKSVESIFHLSPGNGNEREDIRFPLLPGWYNTVSYPINPAEGNHGYVHIITDVTTRRKMEEEKKIADRELLALYAVASRLNSHRSSKRIMVDLLAQLHRMLRIDFSCIHLLERGALSLAAGLGLSREFNEWFRERNTQWLDKLLEGKILTSADNAGYFTREMGMMGGWCAVPLRVGSGVIGILFVAHRSSDDYTDREIYLLSSIANQMAILIENHTLYDRMKEKNEELSRKKRQLKDHLKETEKANRELGRLNAAKNIFIGMASHELKTPITSIKGGLQFLLQYGNLAATPQQKELLEGVYEGVNQLKGIVDDLLCLSRMEAKGFALRKQRLNLSSLSEVVRRTLLLPLTERGITVTIAADAAFIRGDEGYCRLVLRNLLENAVKFTPSGGRITMTGIMITRDELLHQEEMLRTFYKEFPVNVEGVERFYRFEIADNGMGIDEDQRVRIFDKFYGIGDMAGHSWGGNDYLSKGSGLGLSIVKGIMDAHGGMVWVEPGKEGVGSVFVLIFPLSAEDDSFCHSER